MLEYEEVDKVVDSENTQKSYVEEPIIAFFDL